MKRVHHYCDKCGKQMSYVDSDGEVCIQGIEANGMDIDMSIKFSGGSSHSRNRVLSGEYCSYECFEGGVADAMRATSKECQKMEDLP